MTLSTPIHPTDHIFVTVTAAGGLQVLSLRLSGVGSIGEVMQRVSASAPLDRGMLSVQLRNSTQGWQQRRSVAVRRPSLGA